jgi:tetratricopeptide (TPR) repeat protein
MGAESPLWLVKSSGRVLGPFSFEKVAELLRTREVSVLDEVSEPMRRWFTIQYHDDFRDVVDSLRKANLSERTEASWTPNITSNITQTVTDLAGASELTEEITGNLDGFTTTAKEIVVHDVQEQVLTPAVNVNARFQTRGGQSTAVQRQVEKTTRGLWAVTLVVVLAAAAFIVQKRMSSPEARSGQSVKQVVLNMASMGHYAEALKELKSQYPDPTQAGDLSIFYGALLIQVEGQTVMGRRVLNQVIAGKRPDQKKAVTGLGVADLIDGQLDAAGENFDRALTEDRDYVPAIVNLATLNVLKGNYESAKQFAQRALQLNPAQGDALMVLAEAQLYLFKTNKDQNALATVARMARDFRARNWDFRAELGFYEMYFDFLRGDRAMEERLRNYLDTDPRLTEDHVHNVFIYRGRSSWKVLARLCEQMADQLGDSPRVSAFLSSCHVREARWDAARRWIEKSVHQAPKDPLFQAWYSVVLKESGDGDQASVVLGRATELNRRGEYMLPQLLQARFCQQAGETNCAREAWLKLHELNREDLPSLAGLAWVGLQNKNKDEFTKYFKAAWKVSSDYIPLLELRSQSEALGWYANR